MYRILLAAAAAALFVQPANAGPLFNYITDAIARMESRWNGRAYTNTIAYDVAEVTRGTATGRAFTAPDTYRITAIAGCDSDCSQLRLRITDYRGNEVTRYNGGDGSALVSFTPRPGQTYRVHVEPLNCSTAVCYVAWSLVR